MLPGGMRVIRGDGGDKGDKGEKGIRVIKGMRGIRGIRGIREAGVQFSRPFSRGFWNNPPGER